MQIAELQKRQEQLMHEIEKLIMQTPESLWQSYIVDKCKRIDELSCEQKAHFLPQLEEYVNELKGGDEECDFIEFMAEYHYNRRKVTTRYGRIQQNHLNVQCPVSQSEQCQFCSQEDLGSIYEVAVLECDVVKKVRMHQMCALWSSSLKKSKNGQIWLVNVSLRQKCIICLRRGASMKCSVGECGKWYHFGCFMQSNQGGVLKQTKQIVCHDHILEMEKKKAK